MKNLFRLKTLLMTLTLCFVAVSSVLAQNISLKADAMKVGDVMKLLQKRYNYSFSVQSSRIDVERLVTINAENQPIEQVLAQIFEGQNADFVIDNNRIAVIEKRVVTTTVEERPTPPRTKSESFECRGAVYDETGNAVMGASVVGVNSTIGTITDNKGHFLLKTPTKLAIIEVSFLGYATQQIVVGEKRFIEVRLKPDTKSINEVVVIGYGTVQKGDLTGSVANVKMNDVQSLPTLSIDDAMQGRVAGVDVMSSSGDPTASSSIRIRGTRSITASNEPLIVVDGVIDAVSDLSEINTDDIASVSVLKDASSTAIYGSRGANGVIIVTTKEAKPTATKVSVNLKAQFGVSQLARSLDLMNASEFAQYLNDYQYLRGDYTPDTPLEEYAKYPNPMALGKGTDWVKEITRLAPYQNYNISMTGTVKKFRLFASVGFTDKQGIVENSGVQRITGRINVNYDIAKWISFGYRGSYTYAMQARNRVSIGGTNFWNGAIYLNPVLKPADIRNEIYNNSPIINNPRYCLDNIIMDRENLTGLHTALFTIKPVKGLVIKSQNTYRAYSRHDYQFWSNALPAREAEEGAAAYRYEGNIRTLTSENTATYKYAARSGHTFDVMAGYTASRMVSRGISLKADGLINDNLLWGNMANVVDKEKYTVSSSSSKVVKQSVLFRANYNWKRRYYVTFTGRADGSSNFAANHKWGFFPSAALRWNIANEPFMKSVRAVDELSLRFSAGRTGNDAISAYRSLEAITSTGEGYIFGDKQSTALYPSRLANPDLTWEKTDSYNLALDVALFRERLRVTVEGYYAKTTDLLLTVQTADVTGYQNRYENLGRTTNLGWELSIESRNIVAPKFQWLTTLTMSHNQQMVDDIGNEEFVVALAAPGNDGYMMYGYKKGYPLNSLWGFQYCGTWKSEAEIERNKSTRSYVSTYYDPGRARYADINGDGTISTDDLVYQGAADPLIYGGLQNTFYIGKGLKIGVFFNYSIGGKIYNYSELHMCGGTWTNQYRKMINSWHPVRNPNSNIPRAGAATPMLPSNFQIYDASYLRLKSVNVSYTFDLRKRVKWLRDITLGVSGENLWLWTKYAGFDPDVSTESDSSTLRRIDLGAYPKARTIVFNLQIRY
ncbi:MAG: TonB-dependent receptor [Rikenellaceae bacterium]|nr:TonB-dependent receptor [Rikenellaceae bacterium]